MYAQNEQVIKDFYGRVIGKVYTLYNGEWFLLFFEDFSQWNHHEVALVHQWMWYYQVFLVDFHVIVEQNVDVDDAVVIFTVHRLLFPAHIPFNLLCGFKHLMGT